MRLQGCASRSERQSHIPTPCRILRRYGLAQVFTRTVVKPLSSSRESIADRFSRVGKSVDLPRSLRLLRGAGRACSHSTRNRKHANTGDCLRRPIAPASPRAARDYPSVYVSISGSDRGAVLTFGYPNSADRGCGQMGHRAPKRRRVWPDDRLSMAICGSWGRERTEAHGVPTSVRAGAGWRTTAVSVI